jgi:rubrerythrin
MTMDMRKALGTAMKGEIEGRELYLMAAEKSGDDKARGVFTFLAREEDSHLEALKGMYNALLKGEKLSIPSLPRLVNFEDAESPIFSAGFKERLKGRHFEMSALSIAVKLEKDSFQFYGRMAEQSEDDGIKDFFLKLSAWEKDHFEALTREMDFLEEEYFRANHFEPF